MSLIKAIRAQLGLSNTPANNFTLDASADNGTMKLARGNAGATTQDILTVDASGLVTFNQGKQLTQATAQATTSGTTKDFTGIPSWVKRITVVLRGVSVNADVVMQIRIGSGSFASTGYSGTGGTIYTSNVAGSTVYTTGFSLVDNNGVAAVTGAVTLTNIEGNTWVASGTLGTVGGSNATVFTNGYITLAGVLDRVQLVGSATFDAGSVNILYEG